MSALALLRAGTVAAQPQLEPSPPPPLTLPTLQPLAVVATFSVLADVVRHIGGDRVEVRSLVAAGADVHVFQPGPNHARQLAAARLVVSNGLGFEGWIDRLVRSSGYKGPVAVATKGVELILQAGSSGRASADPHAWQSVPNMKYYARNVADALCAVEVGSCTAFSANAKAYATMLEGLDLEIRTAFAAVPADRRKVITSHDAFAYYAREYGVQFLSPMGVNTDAQPSAAAVARLVRQIREEQVSAFFVESISDPRLISRIRDETGGAQPGKLYSDGLSAPDGPASSYEAMMRYNTRAIIEALSAPAAVPRVRR